jgi:pre-rRNA-processing protein RIX1
MDTVPRENLKPKYEPLPPDLRILCRRLTSTPPGELVHLVPALTDHVIRCKAVLSAPQDPVTKTDTSEGAHLVHQLRTIITALLNGKTPAGRLISTVLIKALIDVGGWECLKGCEPWVRGLLSILDVIFPIMGIYETI